MKQNYRIFLLIIGIAVVLYTFLSLQVLLGIFAVSIIIAALIVLPPVERQKKSR